MLRRSPRPPTDEPPDSSPVGEFADLPDGRVPEPDLAALPIVGITRRRLAGVLGTLLAVWVVILFARQVSEAAAATARAEAMVAANTAKKAEIAALEQELDRIQQPRFILQEARGYGLGGSKEVAFTLAPGPSPLPDDAPGSAAKRVGAEASGSPLERWLTLLFGPGG
jgi:hypothetical protein